MNWFEKHLNWTAAVMAVGSIGLFTLFIWLSFGLHFHNLQYIFGLGTPTLILLALLIIFWLLLNALGFVWILYRKKRSLFFLILLLPELFVVIGCIIYKIFLFSAIHLGNSIDYGIIDPIIQTPFEFYIASILILTFTIRWIILLLLKNKNYFVSESQSNSTKTAPRFKYIFLVTSGFNAVLLIVFSLFVNFAYLTYRFPDSINTILPRISFEYPASSNEPVFEHIKVFHSGYPNSDDFDYSDRIYLDNLNGSSVSIFVGVTILNGKDISTYDLENYKKYLLKQYDNPPEYQQIVESEVMVSNIPARQLAISVKHELIDETDWNDIGADIYVFFKYGNKILLISYHSEYSFTPTTTPSANFTHLLETFKIYDK